MTAFTRWYRGESIREVRPPGFAPIRVTGVEGTAPLPDIASHHNDRKYGAAWVLVRAHGEPVGSLAVMLGPEGISSVDLAGRVDDELGGALARHLRADESPSRLPAEATRLDPAPACERRRRAFLADPPFVSVVIPSRDRTERLERCLEVIFACEYPATRFEIVIADNAPATDGTHRLAQDLASAGRAVKYVREDRPGSASARDRGLAVAEGAIVAFTDDDVRVDPRWLTELVRGFHAAKDVSCVTGAILPQELETPAQVWFEQWGGFTRGFERRVFDLGENRLDTPLYPYAAGVYGVGGNMAFRADDLRRIGGFDPGLGNGTPALGGVDSEALLRTVLSGLRLVHEPIALVHHTHHPSFEDLRRQIFSYGTGLSAYLLKTALTDRRHALALAGRVPVGIRFALSPSSSKNAKKAAGYPRGLTWLELRGMAYGPIAYARSRHQFGPHRVPLPAEGGV